MENADPTARRDLEEFFDRLVPENSDYFEHDSEGADDMPSHIRMVLTRSSETIPVAEGRMQLGTWQGIFLFEHRRASHRRKIVVTVDGRNDGGDMLLHVLHLARRAEARPSAYIASTNRNDFSLRQYRLRHLVHHVGETDFVLGIGEGVASARAGMAEGIARWAESFRAAPAASFINPAENAVGISKRDRAHR